MQAIQYQMKKNNQPPECRKDDQQIEQSPQETGNPSKGKYNQNAQSNPRRVNLSDNTPTYQ